MVDGEFYIGIMKISIFEDGFAENLNPLTLTRPVFALRCGVRLLYEKVLDRYQDAYVSLFMRDWLAEAFLEKTSHRGRIRAVNDLRWLRSDSHLIANGRWLFDENLVEFEEMVAVKDDTIVYAYLKEDTLNKGLKTSENLAELLDWAREEVGVRRLDEAKVINYPWDLVVWNGEELRREILQLKDSLPKEDLGGLQSISVVGEREDLLIAKGAKIYPNVVFDTSSGPILVDEGAKILSFSIIQGPSYIGKDSWIVGGKIREGTSIGPVCRVGGEVEETIIHGYTNKYHAGFIGHSYIGEWVNLGALTTTSDLKNDYSNVEVYINGKLINTGHLKVGSFIGDHTKTGIGATFTTGSTVGVMCNLIPSGGPLPKYIPSFVWIYRGRMSKGLGLDPMLRTARKVMMRRGIEMSEAEERLYRYLYEKTRQERERLIKIYRRRGR